MKRRYGRLFAGLSSPGVPDFDRSVNPISTKGANYPHLITTGPLGFSDLPTALEEVEETSDEDEPGMEPIKVANSSPSATRTSLKKKSKKNMSLRRKAEALLRLASAKFDDKSPSAGSSSNSCPLVSTSDAKVCLIQNKCFSPIRPLIKGKK